MTAVSTRAFLLGITLLGTLPLHAQGSGDGFMFRVPTWRLTVETGFAKPRARSDIFDFITSELTLGRGDFASPHIAAALAVRVAPRVEIGFSSGYAGISAESESRKFEGEDDLPILQTTELHRVPLLATARFSLLSPGRSVGRFAWIPRRVVPFVGGGGGAIWYKLRQAGEFVDNESLDIFEDQFESSAWSVGATAFGGTDVSLGARYGLTAEGRYLWAKAPMRQDFSTFNKIDLSGYDASIGLYFRF
ncbi:MAG: hypothetical protein JNJ98_06990 [Gemmatimonadetes bacterium]|nr:hypothetical protein [Gemmatimonadota bacterium]